MKMHGRSAPAKGTENTKSLRWKRVWGVQEPQEADGREREKLRGKAQKPHRFSGDRGRSCTELSGKTLGRGPAGVRVEGGRSGTGLLLGSWSWGDSGMQGGGDGFYLSR